MSLPLETHALDPARVFRLVSALGGRPKRLLVLGCEPTPLDPDEDPMMELSAPVRGGRRRGGSDDRVARRPDPLRSLPRRGRGGIPVGIGSVSRRSPVMKPLEFLGGVVLGGVSLLVLLVGSLFAFGSIGRYLKAKSM